MENELMAPRDMLFKCSVRPEWNGALLLEMLVSRFTYHSKEEWVEKLLNGDVTINEKVANLETIVYRGDSLIYCVRNYKEPEVPTNFSVVFEDDEFILIEKPAGVPVHHTGKIFYNTFTGIVRRALNSEELMPLHRLDRDTGGLMLFAKSRDTAKRFQKNLDLILLKKYYLAVVKGEFPEFEHCKISLSEKENSEIRSQMFPSSEGKSCSTIFRRKKISYEKIGILNGPFSLVEAELETGRKHQIRAHLAALGFPILGDRIYSYAGKYYLKMTHEPLSEEDYALLGARNQLLYAYRVLLRLPYWDSPRDFSVALPESWPKF